MPEYLWPKVAVVGHGLLAVTTRRALGEMLWGKTETADLVWFCEDITVDENDVGDEKWIFEEIDSLLHRIPMATPVMISSQVPVGFCAKLERVWSERTFIIQPENIRRANAAEDFAKQERMIVGVRNQERELCELIDSVLFQFTDHVMYMSPESAEMTKHALNGWLALGIAYANEIADLCDAVGADKADVSLGWRSDARVGSQPLHYGGPFTGGTLGRDVRVMEEIMMGALYLNTPIIRSIRASNAVRSIRASNGERSKP
jgi:UDPglucose 6-dehydrogenase